jgi:hypothetical protein
MLSGSGSHLTAFFRTLMTYAGAFLTVFGMMLLTFVTAGLTNISTNETHICGLRTTQTHQLGCGITDSSAFHIQLNTTRHHFHISFLGARRSTMITNGRTTQTRIYTALIVMIIVHNKSLVKRQQLSCLLSKP